MDRKHALILLSSIGLPLLVYFGGKGIVENAFVETKEFKFNASQQSGNSLLVSISETKRGLYISFGHAGGIGSTKRSYQLSFEHDSKTIQWRGVGVPIILQIESSRFYLATFDRQTNFQAPEFKCFLWDGSWHPIGQNEFSKVLAVQNLMRIYKPEEAGKLYLPATDDVRPDLSNEFRSSLLAKFWFCISFEIPYWKVTESMIEADFVVRFKESLQRKKGASIDC